MSNSSAQSERLKEFIEHTGMSVSQFGKQCDFPSSSTLHNVISLGKRPSQKVLDKIITRFPQLNYDWVVLGYGEMIVKGFDNKPVSADSLQKSTQASFGTIQQSMSDHDFSLNELAKSVEKAINRVDSMSQYVVESAKSSLEKQELMKDLFFEKVDNKMLEIDQLVAQLFSLIKERDQEARDLEDKRIERLDTQRREITEKNTKILFDQFTRLSSEIQNHLDQNRESQKALIQDRLDDGLKRGIDYLNAEMYKNAVAQTDFAIKALMEKFRLSNLIPGLGTPKKESNPKLK
jgi:hypothetical protein